VASCQACGRLAFEELPDGGPPPSGLRVVEDDARRFVVEVPGLGHRRLVAWYLLAGLPLAAIVLAWVDPMGKTARDGPSVWVGLLSFLLPVEVFAVATLRAARRVRRIVVEGGVVTATPSTPFARATSIPLAAVSSWFPRVSFSRQHRVVFGLEARRAGTDAPSVLLADLERADHVAYVTKRLAQRAT